MLGWAIEEGLVRGGARVGEGSAGACVDVAVALGYVGGVEAEIEARLERIGGVLYRLTHR